MRHSNNENVKEALRYYASDYAYIPSRVNNLIYRHPIRRSEDASGIGCETSPVVKKISPVNNLCFNFTCFDSLVENIEHL